MRRFCVLFCLLAVACQEANTEPENESSSQALTADPALNIPVLNEFEVEKQVKEAWSQPIQITPVDWDEAILHPAMSPDKLPQSELEKVADFHMPVLLPSDDLLLANALLITGENWYSASMKGDGVTVVIHGSIAAHNIDLKVEPDVLERMRNFTIYRTHEIVTLTFNMFGVAYALDIECANPTQDIRCNEDDTVLSMAESLVLAGGRP